MFATCHLPFAMHPVIHAGGHTMECGHFVATKRAKNKSNELGNIYSGNFDVTRKKTKTTKKSISEKKSNYKK